MTNQFETLTLSLEAPVARLTINRPDKLNALNEQVLTEMREALKLIHQNNNEQLQGLFLMGAGDKAFIAGADIAQMSKMTAQEGEKLGKLGQEVTVLFEKLRLPVVALVQGFALGGGMEMAMACDFILATKNAIFGQPETKLGLIPGFGGTQRLAKIVGKARAKELIFSGRNISADEAKALGIVLELYDSKTDLEQAGLDLLKSFQVASPLAVSASKKAINEGSDLPVTSGLVTELQCFYSAFNSQDREIGTKAFLSKEKPNFVGH